MVSIALERAGYDIIDIGIDVPKETFLETVQKENPDIVGMSALFTTTMFYMRDVIEAIESAHLRKNIKIIIGGSPVTQSFADEIGADGYAPESESAVTLVRTLLEKKRRNGNPDEVCCQWKSHSVGRQNLTYGSFIHSKNCISLYRRRKMTLQKRRGTVIDHDSNTQAQT
jgi:cobalamin-dependent methionine synthase I